MRHGAGTGRPHTSARRRSGDRCERRRGSIAISLLSKLGYRVIASTGRAFEGDYLRSLGAAEIIDRSTLSSAGKPLGSERWAGAVDSVGSVTLANVLAQTKYRGVVAACGLAQGMDLPGSMAPFTSAQRDAGGDRLRQCSERDPAHGLAAAGA